MVQSFLYNETSAGLFCMYSHLVSRTDLCCWPRSPRERKSSRVFRLISTLVLVEAGEGRADGKTQPQASCYRRLIPEYYSDESRVGVSRLKGRCTSRQRFSRSREASITLAHVKYPCVKHSFIKAG